MELKEYIETLYQQVYSAVQDLQKQGHSVGYPETIEIEWEGIKLTLPFYGWRPYASHSNDE